MRFLIALVIFTLALAGYASASPTLLDPAPPNESFFGRGNVNFSINVTGPGVDTGNLLLFVISEDAYIHGENWDNYTMQCSSYAPDSWKCVKTVSFSIAGTDTLEFFYFQANNTSGTGTKGTSSSPLNFRLDRTPPAITFVSPANGSYVSGNVNMTLQITDTLSGVNQSTVKFSVNNVTWSGIVNGSGSWNSTGYSNNESVVVYISAKDNVGNHDIKNITVIVDNDPPLLDVISPLNGSTVKDVIKLSFNASDIYSGVNAAAARYSFNTSSGNMTCPDTGANRTCSAPVNTTQFSDGKHNITLTIHDTAGNVRRASVEVETKNEKPSILIQAGTYMRNAIVINATIANPNGLVTQVDLIVRKDLETSYQMSCNSGFTRCTHTLNTKSFSDGTYTLTANATNTLNYTLESSISSVIDNTNPSILDDTPAVISGIFAANLVITDANMDARSVSFTLGSAPIGSTCLPQGNNLHCTTTSYNTASQSDGVKTLNISASDLAGNYYSTAKNVTINNTQPGGSGGSGSSGNSGGGGSSDSGANPGSSGSTQEAGGIGKIINDIIHSDQLVFIPLITIVVIVVMIIKRLAHREKKYKDAKPFIFGDKK